MSLADAYTVYQRIRTERDNLLGLPVRAYRQISNLLSFYIKGQKYELSLHIKRVA